MDKRERGGWTQERDVDRRGRAGSTQRGRGVGRRGRTGGKTGENREVGRRGRGGGTQGAGVWTGEAWQVGHRGEQGSGHEGQGSRQERQGRRDRGAIGPGVLAGMWDVVDEFWKVYQVTSPPLPPSFWK